MSERACEVESWAVEPGVGLLVNGEVFPYYVLAEGPMVEPLEGAGDSAHILWLPLIAKGPAPRAGRPDGEPAPDTHPTPTTETRESAGESES